MSSSSSSQPAHGQAEASSSRRNANRQPAIEDDLSDDEGLLSEDPLEHTLPEQYVLYKY
jgi:chloride channel 3/4/5